jgi:carbonic anhydrase
MLIMGVQAFLERNCRWARELTRRDPDYFVRQAARHRPTGLFIGCSDARVPVNVITGTEVGELFVHRNIANQVVATDNNLGAVVQYAVEVLEVKDVIVCGHESCGGVRAALLGQAPPLVDGWLAHVRTVARLHEGELAAIPDEEGRVRRLVELNVREQVWNLSRLPAVQGTWAAGRALRLHGWAYGLSDGLLRDLRVTMDGSPVSAVIERAEDQARRGALVGGEGPLAARAGAA